MGQQDSVRLHRTARFPREEEVGQGGIVNGVAGGQGPLGWVITLSLKDIGLHSQQATVNLAQFPASRLRGRGLQQTDVLLTRQNLDGAVLDAGAAGELGDPHTAGGDAQRRGRTPGSGMKSS